MFNHKAREADMNNKTSSKTVGAAQGNFLGHADVAKTAEVYGGGSREASGDLANAMDRLRLAQGLLDGLYAFDFHDSVCFQALDHQGDAAVYLAAVGVDELLARGLPLPRSGDFSFEVGDGSVPLHVEMTEEDEARDVADAGEDLLAAWCDEGMVCAHNQRLMRRLIIAAAGYCDGVLANGHAWRVVCHGDAADDQSAAEVAPPVVSTNPGAAAQAVR